MTPTDPTDSVVPDPQTPKTLGVLNISYGLGLLLFGLCMGFYALMPVGLSMLLEAEAASNRDRITTAEAEIKKYVESEKTASAEEKAELKKKRVAEEERVKTLRMQTLPFDLKTLREPAYIAYFLADMSTGIFLNFLMLIAGLGLIRLRGWGRWLARGVAWLKLVRLAALAIAMTVVVAPAIARAVASIEEQAMKGTGEPVSDLGMLIGRFLTNVMWGMLVFGAVYPAITIWLLGQPRIRAAFLPKQSRKMAIEPVV